MKTMQNHVRNTFLAGIFAAIPIAVTIFILWWVDNKTRALTLWVFKRDVPIVGIILAILFIYGAGLIATSLIGKSFLRVIDKLIARIPVLRELYMAWKQIALTPGGTEGIFARVAVVAVDNARAPMIAFTSGRGVVGNEDLVCVFVPNAPNPVTGRLYLLPRSLVRMTALSAEEAFKVILSTGNYIPNEIAVAAQELAGGNLS